ncbi:MAG TPA: porin, partial [Pseudolabrys sp.]|nr:porin [Pseudolabrys sp.]
FIFKSIQYVKICSLYGAGFWYIPGTDTCLKIGGFMRYEIDMNASGSFSPYLTGANARFTRSDTRDTNQRTRGVISFDVRSQTAYGTLRSYIRIGAQWTSGDEYTSTPGNAFIDRGFIQLAGFTFGRTQSFFDIYNPAPTESYQTNFIGSASGGSGITVAGYTAQFGNGISASIAAEDRGGKAIFNTGGAAGAVGTTLPNSQQGGFGNDFPDVVANLRVDQAWGSAGISGAFHDVRPTYYGTLFTTGHPDDKAGFAVGAGAVFNLPMLGKGDHIGVEVDYAKGAGQYTNYSLTTSGGVGVFDGQSVALGWNPDAVFAPGGQLELTKSWAVVAGYTHHWLPNLQSSIYGGYLKVEPSTTMCLGAAGIVAPVCDPDWSLWQVGSRTIWNPVENLDVGLEVMYSHVRTAFGGGVTTAAVGAHPAGATIDDNNVWSGIFRVQRNFWP